MLKKFTCYQHVLHTYRNENAKLAAVVLTGHDDAVAQLGCGVCCRLLQAGFSLYSRPEATAAFGIDPLATGGGSGGPRLVVSIHGDDGETVELTRRYGGAPFAAGCI